MHFIYSIQNKINNKVYVGQSNNYKKRWSAHRRSARSLWLEKNSASNSCIQVVHRAMAKHGIENFEFQVIEEWDTPEEADEAECFWIGFLRAQDPACGYNSTPGGRKGVGSGVDHPNYGKPAPNRLWDDAGEKALCDRYTNEQLSITKLAAEYNCHLSTINNILRRHNVKVLGNAVLSKGKHYSVATEFKKGQKAHNKLFSEEQDKEICRQYIEDKISSTEIANKFNCGRNVILGALNNHGVELRNTGFYCLGKSPSNKLFNLEKEKEICKIYLKEKINATNLSKRYGCDRTVITDTLKKHNVKIRGGKLSVEEKRQIAKTYLEIGSYQKVASMFDINKATVQKIVKKANRSLCV